MSKAQLMYKERNGDSLPQKAQSSSRIEYFPANQGIVHIEYCGHICDLKVMDDLYIHDAIQLKDGSFTHSAKGINHGYLVNSIPNVDPTDETKTEMQKITFVTIKYLEEIQEAYEQRQRYVQTIFGLKWLSKVSPRGVQTETWDNFFNF